MLLSDEEIRKLIPNYIDYVWGEDETIVDAQMGKCRAVMDSDRAIAKAQLQKVVDDLRDRAKAYTEIFGSNDAYCQGYADAMNDKAEDYEQELK